ncbi:prephenate dehydratase [Methanolacinia paynteri]|uniref:prephenate dehydratase n=1 Tax=Methanolacinia paynteri TaxID=230356 RepID=UPI00064F7153|nr:prephenate dehydratase domain-containing protein [Methanolacinia paynteri]
MKCAVLGPEGTFSHEMALKVCGRDIILCPTIGAVFAEVASGGCTGIVPLENSEAGGVGETLDGFMKTDCHITAEYYLPVRHHYAAAVPVGEKPSCIYVHPQSHGQCSRFVDDLGVPVIHTASNAASAKAAAEKPGTAAITSAPAAAIHGLEIIRENVQNSDNNVTRFVRVEKSLYPGGYPYDSPDCKKCSILIDPEEDRPGLLYEIIGVFAAMGINLSRIESRPSKRGMGSYVFFIDFAMTPYSGDAVRRLKEITFVKELGCYSGTEVV